MFREKKRKYINKKTRCNELRFNNGRIEHTHQTDTQTNKHTHTHTHDKHVQIMSHTHKQYIAHTHTHTNIHTYKHTFPRKTKQNKHNESPAQCHKNNTQSPNT